MGAPPKLALHSKGTKLLRQESGVQVKNHYWLRDCGHVSPLLCASLPVQWGCR